MEARSRRQDGGTALPKPVVSLWHVCAPLSLKDRTGWSPEGSSAGGCCIPRKAGNGAPSLSAVSCQLFLVKQGHVFPMEEAPSDPPTPPRVGRHGWGQRGWQRHTLLSTSFGCKTGSRRREIWGCLERKLRRLCRREGLSPRPTGAASQHHLAPTADGILILI